MSTQRIAAIRARLQEALFPTVLEIVDDSDRHRGHPGARDGRGHFRVLVVSDRFDGLNRIRRHRLVYETLASLLETDIHALSIDARTPSEQESA